MLDRTETDGRWSQSGGGGRGGSGRDSGSGRATADSADLERLSRAVSRADLGVLGVGDGEQT
jgi:hypothetical protein